MTVKINSIGKTFCPPDWHWDTKEQHWNDMDLWLVLEGKGSIITNGQEYSICRGDCFVFQSSERYLGSHDPNYPLTVIHIHFDLAELGEMEVPQFHRYIINPEFLFELAQRVLNHVDETNINSQDASLWLKVLLKEITRIDQKTNKDYGQSELQILIGEICRFITSDLTIHHRVKALSDRSGYSHDHFSKVFKEIQGVTPEKYMINKRIQSACSLLSESNMSIIRISGLLGYKESEHFSKQFKSIIGKSPRAYRNSN